MYKSVPTERRTVVLAVASAGGHWDELFQILPAFSGMVGVSFATTDLKLAQTQGIESCFSLSDYSQSSPIKVLKGLVETHSLVRRLKPDVVLSTGAAPGLLCLFWGRIFGAKTIWIDSIANAECLSLSGKIAKRIATVTVSQWETVSQVEDVEFWGSVL